LFITQGTLIESSAGWTTNKIVLDGRYSTKL
jgi:hypothetical protein